MSADDSITLSDLRGLHWRRLTFRHLMSWAGYAGAILHVPEHRSGRVPAGTTVNIRRLMQWLAEYGTRPLLAGLPVHTVAGCVTFHVPQDELMLRANYESLCRAEIRRRAEGRPKQPPLRRCPVVFHVIEPTTPHRAQGSLA